MSGKRKIAAGAAIIVVGVIIGWLSIELSRQHSDAEKNAAHLGCKSLSQAIGAWLNNPSSSDHDPPRALSDLLHTQFGETAFLRNGAADLLDPWGQPYEMETIKLADGKEDILVKTTAPDGTPISQFGIGPASRVR